VEKMEKDVAEVRERIAKLEGLVSQLITRIDDLKRYVDGRISDLSKRLDYVAKVSWTPTISVIAALIANIVMMYLAKFIQ